MKAKLGRQLRSCSGFFTPFSRRPSRRLRTRFPALILRTTAGKLRQLRRPASSEPDSLKARREKAKPSQVALVVSRALPFQPTLNGREPKLLKERLSAKGYLKN